MKNTRKRFCLSLALLLILLLTSESAWAAKAKSFESAAADVSIRLLQECMKGKAKKNALISPDSILTAVSMVEEGAAGKTLSEMEKALGGISVDAYTRSIANLNSRIAAQDQVIYRSANSIWYKESKVVLKEPYLEKVRSVHKAEVTPAAFDSSTVAKINGWVSEKTEGKIPVILDRLDANARIALINAVYFKGKWQEPYKTTTSRTFTRANGKKQKVPMLEGTEHSYVTLAGGTGFVKDYSGGKLAFMTLLPPKGTSVSAYLKKLTGAGLIKAYRNRNTSVTVKTLMPEFKCEYGVSLKNPLKRMGIRRVWTGDADFSKMTDSDVCIDDILHKTYIDVNKEGTEAAAVTAVMMKANAVFVKKKIRKVYLTRPFVYAIIDTQTGIPLFLGVLNEVP